MQIFIQFFLYFRPKYLLLTLSNINDKVFSFNVIFEKILFKQLQILKIKKKKKIKVNYFTFTPIDIISVELLSV